MGREVVAANEVQIRQATVNDVERLVPIGQAFFAEFALPGRFNPTHFCQMWERVFTSGLAVVVIAERDDEVVGAIGVLLYPDLNTGDLWAQETFWYVAQEQRRSRVGIELFIAMECLVRERGAVGMRMIHLTTSDARLQKWYAKRGYRPLEVCYIKEWDSWPLEQRQR